MGDLHVSVTGGEWERSSLGSALFGGDAESGQEMGVGVGGEFHFSGIRLGTLGSTIFQRLGNEQHPAACRTPEMHHHAPIAGKDRSEERRGGKERSNR